MGLDLVCGWEMIEIAAQTVCWKLGTRATQGVIGLPSCEHSYLRLEQAGAHYENKQSYYKSIILMDQDPLTWLRMHEHLPQYLHIQ